MFYSEIWTSQTHIDYKEDGGQHEWWANNIAVVWITERLYVWVNCESGGCVWNVWNCVFVCLSVCMCVHVAARRDLNVVSNQKRLDYLNNVATGIIFATTVINFFISFFGSKRTGFFRWLLARLHFWDTQNYENISKSCTDPPTCFAAVFHLCSSMTHWPKTKLENNPMCSNIAS